MISVPMAEVAVLALALAGLWIMLHPLRPQPTGPDRRRRADGRRSGAPPRGEVAGSAHRAVEVGVAAAYLTTAGAPTDPGELFAGVLVVGAGALAAMLLAPRLAQRPLAVGGLAAALIHVAVTDGAAAAAEVALAALLLLAGLHLMRARLADAHQ